LQGDDPNPDALGATPLLQASWYCRCCEKRAKKEFNTYPAAALKSLPGSIWARPVKEDLEEPMLAQPREAVRVPLPSKVVHAYRLVRHTLLWPNEWETVAAKQFLAPDKIAVDVGANVGPSGVLPP
jgi:hypothetical protein